MFTKKIIFLTILLVIILTITSVAQNFEEAERLYLTGRSLSFDRKYAEAIDTLKASYSMNTNNPRTLLLLGNIYIKIGNIPGAEQAFNQLREITPHKPQGYVKLAEVNWHVQNYELALEYLKTAANLGKPPHADVFRWMGQVFRSQNKYAESDSTMRSGLAYYPTHPELLAGYGTTLIYMGDTSRAHLYIDSAYQTDSNSIYVINTMASYQMFSGNLVEASRLLERAAGLDPDDPFTRSNIVAYKQSFNHAKTLKHYTDGNQNFSKALYRKAKADYLLALAQDSLFFEVIVNLGFTSIHLGELEEAARYFEKAVTLNPNYVPGYVGWGDALISIGQIEEGFAKYEKALELDPNNKDIKAIYDELKQAKAALDAQVE